MGNDHISFEVRLSFFPSLRTRESSIVLWLSCWDVYYRLRRLDRWWMCRTRRIQRDFVCSTTSFRILRSALPPPFPSLASPLPPFVLRDKLTADQSHTYTARFESTVLNLLPHRPPLQNQAQFVSSHLSFPPLPSFSSS